ncbi:MAG: hypothetical protein D6820_15445, partial [Lentisphaerae bacterium]
EEIRLASSMHHRTQKDSFHILYALDNPVTVKVRSNVLELFPGQVCLIPAATGFYSTIPPAGESARLLRII